MSFVRCWRLLCLFFLVVSSTPFIATPSLFPSCPLQKDLFCSAPRAFNGARKKKRKIYLEVEFELAMDTFMEFIKTNGSHWHRDRDTIHLHAPLRFMLIFVVVVAVVVVGARKPNLQLISVANWVKIAWRLCVYATHLLRIRPVRPSICELLLVKQRAQSIGQFMEIIWAPPLHLAINNLITFFALHILAINMRISLWLFLSLFVVACDAFMNASAF